MFKGLKEKLLIYKVSMIEKKLQKASKKIIKKYDLKSYRIIDGKVLAIDSNLFSNSINITDKRVYLNILPGCMPKTLIDHLKELSLDNVMIQLDFDKFASKNNIEIEFYVKNDSKIKDSFLEFTEQIKGCEIGKDYYKKLLQELN